ncbi:MAG: hypothetical protein SGI71_00210 [Verrucomicrobiota bacterium]|nr:hypothetical protein [Verrucomicrobiota bacterium]
MKSAYELAMERLNKQSPAVKLSDEQKKEIAEVDSIYKAKIAERELFLEEQLQKSRAGGDQMGVEQITTQLARERRKLHEEGEEKKEQIRKRTK